jgi:aldehyde dehydrogenase (NAD+)
MTIAKVKDMDEAVALTNDSRYALGSAVFSKSHGMKIAERLRVGMTSINGVITFAGVPSLPFGGIGDSGFGRIHGPDGLKEFTYAHAIARQRMKPLLALTTFKRTEKADQQLGKLITMLHGRGSTLPKQ